MSEYILEMDNICKSFSGVQVLHHVNLKVRKGTLHALMGENGAGKSTLMKILIGAHRADSGTIRFNSYRILLITFKHFPQASAFQRKLSTPSTKLPLSTTQTSRLRNTAPRAGRPRSHFYFIFPPPGNKPQNAPVQPPGEE